jgi:peptidoglycan/xylan/chitin deacetylase (PgdA/CDA1 family)
MEALAASGRAISIDAAVDALAGPPPGGSDPVVVTFDDGTADLVEHALPVLERHHVPACWYVATDFVDAGREFPAGGTPLSWAQLRDAAATGLVTVGSHTHTHALLDRLPVAQAEAELDRSIECIGEHVGVAPRHFAYPKALAPPADVEAAVRARFASAALAGTRANPYGRTDVHRLARSPIQVADGMRWFARKAAGGLAFEDTVRRVANRARYAGATT